MADPIDTRLTEYAGRWRDTLPAPSVELAMPPAPDHRHRWVVLGAAVAVAAVIAVAVGLRVARPADDSPQHPGDLRLDGARAGRRAPRLRRRAAASGPGPGRRRRHHVPPSHHRPRAARPTVSPRGRPWGGGALPRGARRHPGPARVRGRPGAVPLRPRGRLGGRLGRHRHVADDALVRSPGRQRPAPDHPARRDRVVRGRRVRPAERLRRDPWERPAADQRLARRTARRSLGPPGPT